MLFALLVASMTLQTDSSALPQSWKPVSGYLPLPHDVDASMPYDHPVIVDNDGSTAYLSSPDPVRYPLHKGKPVPLEFVFISREGVKRQGHPMRAVVRIADRKDRVREGYHEYSVPHWYVSYADHSLVGISTPFSTIYGRLQGRWFVRIGKEFHRDKSTALPNSRFESWIDGENPQKLFVKHGGRESTIVLSPNLNRIFTIENGFDPSRKVLFAYGFGGKVFRIDLSKPNPVPIEVGGTRPPPTNYPYRLADDSLFIPANNAYVTSYRYEKDSGFYLLEPDAKAWRKITDWNIIGWSGDYRYVVLSKTGRPGFQVYRVARANA